MNNLKAARKAKGMTQAEVARAIGLTQNGYSYWENGKAKIDKDQLVKLAELFEVSTDYLLGVDPQPSSNSVTEDDIKAAFFNGADPTLTPEERDAMWEDAQEYFRFKIEQRRRKQQDGE